jgi:hypothetical protein
LSRRQRRPQWRGEAYRRCGNLVHGLRVVRFPRAALGNRPFGPGRGWSRNRLRANRLRRRFRRTFPGARNFGRGTAGALARHALADQQSYVVVERTGVRLLVGDAQFRQRLENYVGLYFELAGQLIDANFTHTMTFRKPNNAANGFSRKFGFSFSGIRCGGPYFRALYPIRFVFNRLFGRRFNRRLRRGLQTGFFGRF